MNIPTIISLVVVVAFYYFFVMRPQQKRKKEQQELKESLAPGCEITTIGGIIGKIVQVTENHVVFETSEDGVRIQVAKWAIANKGMVAEQPQS